MKASAGIDPVQRYLNIAASQIGYTSGAQGNFSGTGSGEKYTEYLRHYNNNGNDQWCAAFVSWCAEAAGLSSDCIGKSAGAGSFRKGDGGGTFHPIWNTNFQTYLGDQYTPQPGDIMCYVPQDDKDDNRKDVAYDNNGNAFRYYHSSDGSSACSGHYLGWDLTSHVGIVETVSGDAVNGWIVTTIERKGEVVNRVTTNTKSRNARSACYHMYGSKKNGYDCSTVTIPAVQGFYHPNWNAASVWDSSAVDFDVPENIGDVVYASILNVDSWKPITEMNDDYNVILHGRHADTESSRQIWKFTRQEDDSYVITSCHDGHVLEMTEGQAEEGRPVTAPHANYWGGAYEQWFLYATDQGFIIKSKHFPDDNWVLELCDGNTDDGTSVQIARRNDSSKQRWYIYSQDDIPLQGPTLQVIPGNSSTETQLTWSHSYGADAYNVHIANANGALDGLWECKTENGSILLPAGQYTAYVDAYDFYRIAKGNDVQFEIAEGSADLGQTFYATISLPNSDMLISEAEDNYLVTLNQTVTGSLSARQLWRFDRQSDNAYVITSCYDGHILEMTEGRTESGCQITAPHNNFWGGAYQQWMLIRTSNSCILKNKHFSEDNWVLELRGDTAAEDTPVQIAIRDGSSKQNWNISILEPQLSQMEIVAGTPVAQTSFHWNDIFGVTDYTVYVESETGDLFQVQTSETSAEMLLPEGTYTAIISAENYYLDLSSSPSEFVFERTHHLENGICIRCGKRFDTDGLNILILPKELNRIESAAFANTSADVVILPDSIIKIDEGAFQECTNLRYVFLPEHFENTENIFPDETQLIWG